MPPQAPQVLAGALHSLAAQPERANELGRAGNARIRESYSIDQMVDRYVDLYREVARRSFNPADVESAPCA